MILDFGDGFFLRRAEATDHDALSAVCLKTGDAGADATAIEDDPRLLGLLYAIPYQVFEPDLAFAVQGPDGVVGYLFGARDTAAFEQNLEADWYPQLRRKITDPGADRARWRGSDWARYLIHHLEPTNLPALKPYPSHGHIDLLLQARGRGIGTRAMRFLEERLAAIGSPGMHLQVHPANLKAQRFYRQLGFAVLDDASLPDTVTYMVKRLA